MYKKIETKLGKMKDVDEVKIKFHSIFDEGKVSQDEIKETIEKLGYPVVALKAKALI
ncbi:heavy-metal-associated domain-containing protein [Virgibacillus oceani]